MSMLAKDTCDNATLPHPMTLSYTKEKILGSTNDYYLTPIPFMEVGKTMQRKPGHLLF